MEKPYWSKWINITLATEALVQSMELIWTDDWEVTLCKKYFFTFWISFIRSSHYRCSIKQVFLNIWQNSQENTSARASFLIKLKAWGVASFLRAPFLRNTSRRLLLFFRCEQIQIKLLICSHLLKKFLMENFTFCAVTVCQQLLM